MSESIKIPEEPVVLRCPSCGNGDIPGYMHHTRVRVQFRDQEDHDGTEVTVSRGSDRDIHNSEPIKTEIVRRENWELPGHRDIIFIRFTCENGCLSTLQIQQHKGRTLMSMTCTKSVG